MRRTTGTRVRAATLADAPLVAKLIDIAGEGIPQWLWCGMAGPDESALQIGAARAARETGGFSYRHAWVAETPGPSGGEPAGMVLAYPLETPSEHDRNQVVDLPAPIRPFVELEHEAAGTFYVNALAVLPGRRGKGLGSLLMLAAETEARERGHAATSIQVYEQNEAALRLYQRLGYRPEASRPVLHHPCQPYYDGRIVLLVKAL
jgi:ribosomal protein S18 acetylase RimI-like enzyme